VEHRFAAAAPRNAYGDAPFTTPGDFSAPNEAYFAHADRVIAEAARQGLLVLLAPAYLGAACGGEGWCAEMRANGPEKLRRYGAFIGARYARFRNIVWVHGGDAEAAKYGAAHLVRAVIDGIRGADRASLHTAHCFRGDSALDCYDEDWLALNNTYSDCRASAARIRDDFERQRRMPFLFIEGRYENESASPICLRSQAYWAVLGGAGGHVFGNRPVWLFARGWQRALGSPGAQAMRHFGALFASRPWHRLVPDYGHEVLIEGYGDIAGSGYVGAARADDGSTFIAYFPQPARATIDLSRLSGAAVRAWWFNPASGRAFSIGTFAVPGAREFSTPPGADWVLVLDDAAAGRGAPGAAASTD
jgi:hypothetical protein